MNERTHHLYPPIKSSTSFESPAPPLSSYNQLTHPPTHPPSPPIQYAYWILVNYREAYDMFLVNGILFNHEVRKKPTHPPTRPPT